MELHQMYITPSNFAKIIGKGKQHPFNKTALEYADEIIMGSLGVEKEQLKVWALQHGVEYEPYAIQKFECKNFETVLSPERSIHHALIPYIKGRPDGIVNDEHIIEVKCPYNPTNHLKNLTDFSSLTTTDLSKSPFISFIFFLLFLFLLYMCTYSCSGSTYSCSMGTYSCWGSTYSCSVVTDSCSMFSGTNSCSISNSTSKLLKFILKHLNPLLSYWVKIKLFFLRSESIFFTLPPDKPIIFPMLSFDILQ